MRNNTILICLILLLVVPNYLTIKIYSQTSIKQDTVSSNKTTIFFDSLEIKAQNNRWTKELFDVMVKPNKKKKASTVEQITTSPLEKYNGMLIRKIEIKRIDIFGPEVYDTIRTTNNVLEKTANNLHIKTSYRIIKNHLIIKQGHYLDHHEIADNERILRTLPYINDVRIIVSNHDNLNNTVDLLVIIKDVWTKGFGLEVSGIGSGKFDIWDNNFLGTGHEFTNMVIWDESKVGKIGYTGEYEIKNIYGSFINSTVTYTSAFDKKEYGFKIDRRFYTPQIKYAGGISYLNSKRDNYFKNQFLNDTIKLDYDFTDIWVGRSYNINNRLFPNYRTNIVLSAAYIAHNFTKTAPVEPNFMYNYQSRALIIGSISLSSQNFYKTNFLYSFGRTEDIPIGILASIHYGFEKNTFKNRTYTSALVRAGYYFSKFGYLFNQLNISFFRTEVLRNEQVTIQNKINYFTDLYKIGNFRFRQFVKFNYVNGTNRFIDEYISINRSYGIRGFKSDSLFHNKKIVINFESVIFTPLYFYGFRFVTYGFFDIAYTGASDQNILRTKSYKGFGLGIRIRNDRLVFRTIQLEFGIYPNAPADMDLLLLRMSGEPRLKPDNFYVTKPEIYQYK